MATRIITRFQSRVLFTGTAGQIGGLLLSQAQEKYGDSNVLATDLKEPLENWKSTTLFEKLDVTDTQSVQKVFNSFKPTIVYHLASTLSAPSELNPNLAFKVNITGLHNILENSLEYNSRIFAASSIASFGPSTPKIPGTLEIQRPVSIYGITKVHLELMGEYYFNKHGIDFRCLRVPIITSEAIPGGGSAAFTVTAFYDLLTKGKTEIPVSPETKMPLLYLPDLIRSINEFMGVDRKFLRFCTYTMGSAGISTKDYIEEVTKYTKGEVEYKPDFRDAIVKSWPDGTDSKEAYNDWGHKIYYDVPKMVRSMYENISKIVGKS